MFMMYTCDQQKMYIDAKDLEMKALYNDFLAMPVWKTQLTCLAYLSENNFQVFGEDYNKLIAREIGCEFNADSPWETEKEVTNIYREEGFGVETILFLAQQLLSQAQLINFDITDDLLFFFQARIFPFYFSFSAKPVCHSSAGWISTTGSALR